MGFSNSEAVQGGPLTLSGVWIHDPVDPEGTVKQYPVGKAQRSTQIDTLGTEQRFAGRERPVVDYGEHTDRTFSINIDVTEGPELLSHQETVEELRDFHETKRTLYLRDNRGRAMAGRTYGFVVQDANWGSNVQLTFGEVDTEMEEVTV